MNSLTIANAVDNSTQHQLREGVRRSLQDGAHSADGSTAPKCTLSSEPVTKQCCEYATNQVPQLERVSTIQGTLKDLRAIFTAKLLVKMPSMLGRRT